MIKTWYVVPVRGGSKGLPRKNARLLGDKPLMSHVLTTLKTVDKPEQTIVITDDEELEAIAEKEGVRVFKEPLTTGKATLDEVCLKILPELEGLGAKKDDIILTIQATCPYVSANTIVKARDILKKEGGGVLTVMDDRHLNWTVNEDGKPQPLYKERLNRQYLPPNFRESGAVIGSVIGLFKKTGTRINEPINIVEIEKKEGLDIDTYADWAVAEHYQNQRKILVRADAGKTIGMGHVYRAITMAQEMAQHELVFATKNIEGDTLGRDFLMQYPYKLFEFNSDKDFSKFAIEEGFDYIFLDQLSTTRDYIRDLKKSGAKVITFEDLGTGAIEADLVINDLYKISGLSKDKQLYGLKYSFLPPLFQVIDPQQNVKKTIDNILILFGGTDPLNLTVKTLESLQSLKYKGFVTVVQGMGRLDREINLDDYQLEGRVLSNINNIAKVMREADLAFSSAGRTITELLMMRVPTVCICQNERELTHSHASQRYGVHNLGLGNLISNDTLQANIQFVIENLEFRKMMHMRAKEAMDGHSNRAVIKHIANKLGDNSL